MDMQTYSEMIHGIVVPATLSPEEMFKCYQPLTDFLQVETPERLYRFRRCDERSISAFDQDQLWFSPGYKMNDDFDALLHFNKENIKSELKSFLENDQFRTAFWDIGEGAEVPVHIQNLLSSEMLEALRKNIAQMDESTMSTSLNQLYDFFVEQIDANDIAVHEIVQKTIKFACFSEAIESAAMWGYYADSGCGFALSYDFRNGGYTICNSCLTGNLCPSYKSCLLAPVIYGDTCFNATRYATWLFQQRAIFKILADKNATSFYSYLQNIVPCPDLFMPTKILLHKASAWGHVILLILINKSSPGQKRSLQQYILDEKSVQFTRKFFAILLLTKIFLSIKCRFDRTIQSIGCILKKYHKKRNRGRVFTLPVFHYAQTPF